MRKYLFILLFAISASASAQTIDSQWKGKKVAFIGDSITDPGQTEYQTVYWQNLAEILGIEPLVYAVSGYQMWHIPELTGRLMKEQGKDVDAILVFLGTNDYNSSTPMGEWYTLEDRTVNVNGEMVTRHHRDFCFDEKTYRGRINIGMKLLKTEYPDAQIIFLTPIHRAYANFGKHNVQPDENYANGQGLFVESYVEAIKEAGSLWAVPVIDLNAICGLNPTLPEYLKYFRNPDTDQLHPNSDGHLRMALAIAYQLLAYPL